MGDGVTPGQKIIWDNMQRTLHLIENLEGEINEV
jgi:hypothetical protein